MQILSVMFHPILITLVFFFMCFLFHSQAFYSVLVHICLLKNTYFLLYLKMEEVMCAPDTERISRLKYVVIQDIIYPN